MVYVLLYCAMGHNRLYRQKQAVTIECNEHDVTCLNERVGLFIKTMSHLLTNCSQSTLLAIVCTLSLLVLKTS